MPPKTQACKTPEIAPKRSPGKKGKSTLFHDGDFMSGAYFHNRHYDDDRMYNWLEALFSADERHDLTPLLDALRHDVPAEILPHIQDFFSRYNIKPKRGKARQTPSYNPSEMELKFHLACEAVVEKIRNGATKIHAIAEVAEEQSFTVSALTDAYEHKRASLERMRKKLKELDPPSP